MASGHVDKSKPLKPLSAHAWGDLAWISNGPVESRLINPGVQDRFRREGLIDYVTDAGRQMVQLTDAGRAKLKERP